MAEDARSTLLFQLSFEGGGSELPDLEQCAREDEEMRRRMSHALVAREEAHDESQDTDLEQTMADWRHAQQQRLQELLAAASAEVADLEPDLLSLTGLGLSDADETGSLGESISRFGLGESNQQHHGAPSGAHKGPAPMLLTIEAVDAERAAAAARQQRDDVRAQLQARESARMAMVRDLMGGSASGAAAPGGPGPSGPLTEGKAPAQTSLPLPTSATTARSAAAWARDNMHGSGAALVGPSSMLKVCGQWPSRCGPPGGACGACGA